MRLRVWLTGAVFIAAGVQAFAQGASYPSKPVTIIVPGVAGGGLDTTARILAEGLRKHFNQTFLVENRPGAATALGATVVYRAPPDGYMLLQSPNSPLTFLPVTKKSLPYEATKLTPIAITGIQPFVMTVKPQFAGNDFASFLAHARANPGKLNYASPGIGSANHLATLMFQKVTGTDMVHVPFSGGTQAIQEMLRGDIDFYMLPQDGVYELYRSGKLKIFAVGTPERSKDLPEVPTFRELGLPNEVRLTVLYALLGPPGMPADVAAKLNEGVNAVFKMPDVIERYRQLRIEPTGGKAETLRDLILSELAVWGKVAKDNAIEVD